MKTSRFEEILRRKLESFNPDFQKEDWAKFQSFQQAAPSFWQTYGPWVGYAVAVVTTGVMVALYMGQSRQNDGLMREMKELRAQMAGGTGVPPVIADSLEETVSQSPVNGKTGWQPVPQPHSDTVYIIEPRVIYRDYPVHESKAMRDDMAASANDQSPLNFGENFVRQKNEEPKELVVSNDIREKSTNADQLQERLALNDISPLPTPLLPEAGKTEYRRLLNRMPKSVNRRDIPVVAKSEKATEGEPTPSKPAFAENPGQITKERSLLPKFGLNLPFRVGAGQQWEGRTKAFSLWNEVLLGEHWSVQAGLSWQKLEDQKFFSERLFKEKMRRDFRNDHAPKLPPNFDIFNIIASTKIVRIPLNLTYRNEIGNGFSYFVGAGTNLNLRAKQTLSFDYKRPSRDFGQETKERTIPFPLINNANGLVGVEKRWSPIVLQVSSFLNTRFKTFPFLDDRTDVGLQVKLLYELKADKKK